MTGAQQRKDWTMTAATARAEARKETPEVDEAEAEAGMVCVPDLGEHRRKRHRKLRQGEGRLKENAEEAVASLPGHGWKQGRAAWEGRVWTRAENWEVAVELT